ncbi:hypothetical protein DEO72_LG9g1733 [Vigna unguiculata]|uniref:TF-B3 domain-containing protein n=1 Tax=Vigna unguiculata TaxID=3917 RepID=A0A4D6N2H8_VIGUN|nr:hypothetical protein DEO72_LG9g1733 [Vigna unguiculata]
MEIVLQDKEIIFNCDVEDATKLKKITESPSQPLTQLCQSSKVSLEDDFIKLHPRSSIEESTFIVKATIKHVLDHDDVWYTTCIWHKAVYPDSKMFFCEKCNKHVIKVTPRYKLKLSVIDATDSTTFVVFDRDASAMLKKSCYDILDLQDKDLYSANEEESKVNDLTNQISSDSIAEDLLIKFTEESNDVETLSDHLNTIVSSHVSAKESLNNKVVIDVEIDELTRKESSHLDNLHLATQPPVPALKRHIRSMVQENKKIPVKMLNIKIENHNLLAQSKCVDIILHCQHHNHASYTKGKPTPLVLRAAAITPLGFSLEAPSLLFEPVSFHLGGDQRYPPQVQASNESDQLTLLLLLCVLLCGTFFCDDHQLVDVSRCEEHPRATARKQKSHSPEPASMDSSEFGHVDPIFFAMFGQELGLVWQLEDIQGNQHQLTFNMDVNHPVLTDGWTYNLILQITFKNVDSGGWDCRGVTTLSLFNEFGHVDPIFFAMFGQELGLVWQLEDIQGNQHQLTFNMDVNHPVLTDDYVQKRRFRRLGLQGRDNTFIVQCKLVLRNSPKKSSKIGKGWKDFCTFNRLKEGDILVFVDYVQKRRFRRLGLQGRDNTFIVQCKLVLRNSPKKSSKIGKGWKDFCTFNRLKEGDILVFVEVRFLYASCSFVVLIAGASCPEEAARHIQSFHEASLKGVPDGGDDVVGCSKRRWQSFR